MRNQKPREPGFGHAAAQLPDAAEVIHWERINHGETVISGQSLLFNENAAQAANLMAPITSQG
jgi:hypothetical protein